jgi:hypothetical protein
MKKHEHVNQAELGAASVAAQSQYDGFDAEDQDWPPVRTAKAASGCF